MTNSAGIANVPKAPSPVVAKKEDYIPQPKQQLNGVKNIIFKLINSGRGDVYLPLYKQNVVRKRGEDGSPIYDTLRVLKGVYTIWESEQKDVKMDAKTLSKSRRSVKFQFMGKDNIAMIPSDDIHVLEAMRTISDNIEVEGHNKASRFAFYEINPAKQAEIEAQKRAQRRKAVRQAEEQTLDKIKKHAAYLRIRVLDDYGYPKVEKALRNEYEDYAEQNADRFLASLGSPEVEVAFLISKALSDAKIDISTHKGSAYWAAGGFICRVPSNQNAAEYLVEFAMNSINEDSKAFKEQLEAIVT
jgi:hypothetical protein